MTYFQGVRYHSNMYPRVVYLISSLLNGFANLRIQTIGHVNLSSSLLEDTKGLDQGLRHAFTGTTNVKVLKGAISILLIRKLISVTRSMHLTVESEHPSSDQQGLGDHQKCRVQNGIFAMCKYNQSLSTQGLSKVYKSGERVMHKNEGSPWQ